MKDTFYINGINTLVWIGKNYQFCQAIQNTDDYLHNGVYNKY